jgi:superoxide reductase
MAATLGEHLQSADWKSEKHVPVIDCPDSVKEGERFTIQAAVGKEIGHPNTTEHHIRWIQLYFKPDDEKFIYQLGNFAFTAHGESVEGANEGPSYAEPDVQVVTQLKKSGTLIAESYCNIHGLWENAKAIKVSV